MLRPLALGLVVAALSVGSAAARPAAGPPTVKVTSPSHCACGITAPQSSTVTIIVAVTNFKLSAKDYGKPAVPGEGHLGFSLDHGKFDKPAYSGANGKLAVKSGTAGKFSPSVTPKITYSNLPTGDHVLVVYLVSNANKKLGPSDTVKFEVR